MTCGYAHSFWQLADSQAHRRKVGLGENQGVLRCPYPGMSHMLSEADVAAAARFTPPPEEVGLGEVSCWMNLGRME